MQPALQRRVIGKLEQLNYGNGIICYRFYCLSCKAMHTVVTRDPEKSINASYRGKAWKFNGDFERPSFTPDIMTFDGGVLGCVVQVNSGRLVYLSQHPVSAFRNRMYKMQNLEG